MPIQSYTPAFTQRAREAPVCTAVILEGERFSRQALEQRSKRLAGAYQALGGREGDRVVIAVPNSIEFIEAVLASWRSALREQRLARPVSGRS